MTFEIHVTVQSFDKDQFIRDCLNIGVKPVIIENELKDGTYETQFLTSSKHEELSYRKTLDYLVHDLERMGYPILRQKVEIYPSKDKSIDHKYYESHLRLRLPIDVDITEYKYSFLVNDFFLSKNIMKKKSDHYYQMLTFRTSNEKWDFDSFKNHIESMVERIKNKYKLDCDKVELEECIYDTNPNIDYLWLN